MEQKAEHHIVATRTFILVWIALLGFTALTIEAAHMQMGGWSMVANIAIASSKASLVLWFFMHLKYERPLLKFLIFVPLVTISIIIGLTFFDIWYR